MSRKSRKTRSGNRVESRAPCTHGRRHCRKLGEGLFQGRQLRFECLETRRLLSLQPIISEVDPSNKTGIVDTLGNTADWLEIYNPDPTSAANLSGWSLSYQKTGSSSTSTWTFPNNVVLGPGEFRVIFCDSNYTAQELAAETALGELDTGFNLSKAGATVQLINASSAVVNSLTYPALSSDTSYGPLETVAETDLVAAGATASYYAPTSNALGTTWTQPGFSASSWASGPTGLGFANSVPGFACTAYESNISGTISSVETAEQVINTPSEQTLVINATESDLNFLGSGGGNGHFGNDNPFPGTSSTSAAENNYVMQSTGTLTITSSQAGYYTFGVNSDDGFSLTITGADFTSLTGATNATGSNTMEYDGSRGAADTLGTTYLAAGSYPLNLVYFQGNGGWAMEFYAAKESSSAGVTSFDANSILVGATTATTASGGTSTTTTPLAVNSTPFTGTASSGAFSAAVATNVKSAVQAAITAAGATSLYTRITFNAPNLAALTSLTLKMQYADGYVAYLNGVEIASSNAPASPTWNSQALAQQTSSVQATTYENVDVSSFLNPATTGCLTATGNVLAIQVLMASKTATQMLVVPELAQMTSVVGGDFIYSTPTPGAPNTLADVQAGITFSATHGLYYAPVQVTLTPNVAGTPIYYTTDNSTPGSYAVSSITYSGTTATVTTQQPIGFCTGDEVQIANAIPAVYDGTFAITVPEVTTTGIDGNTFTYTLPSTPSANASATAGAVMTATHGTLYTGPITIPGTTPTTVLQAAMVAGGSTAPYQTETYVFPDAVATQPADPIGYPAVWDGTIGSQDIAADYAMSSVPGYTTAQIASALSSLPSMSIVTTNANMFGASGIYSNSQVHDLEAPCSLEYFNPLTGTTDWEGLAGLEAYGGVGRDTQYLKHGLEVVFDQSDGPSVMDENLFGDGYFPKGLVLRQGFNDGWSWGGASTQFIIDSWVRDTLTALGTQNQPGIWVQLFVNGLYWGVYNAVADINSNYAAYFFGGQSSDYDVYHYSSDGFEVKQGTIAPWTAMFNVATYGNAAGTGTASPTVLASPTAYALMAQYLNLPSFCDYIIVNYYGANWDWDWHNYSALYRPGLGFIFQDWDGEGNLLNAADGSETSNITSRDTTGDPTQLFVQLLANPDFRQMFADHVYKDLSTALSPTGAAAIYQSLANTISTAVLDESARWGNLGELDGTWNELGTPATWTTQLDMELGSWFPARTATMFSQFATAVTFSPATGGSETYTMYPSFSPPVLSVNGTVENGGTVAPGAALTMAASTGTIYYTTDGSDPRVSGTNFTIASITLSGTTATVTIDNTATGFSNGEQISIGGATQTQYNGSFTIANVTVNSTAGTTTFTCTVSGSPTSPATPLAGQSLIAATAVGGAVSATAHVYTGAITLSASETINARVLSGSTWSALNSSTFYVNLSSIVVTEVMYDPLPATSAEIAAGYVVSDTSDPYRDFQYIEVENIGTQTLPVGGLQISGGIDFTFPEYEGNVSTNPVLTLAPNHYLVVVADLSAFTIRYGAELQAKFGSNWQNLIVAGQFANHHLNDVSDEVELSSPNGGVIEDFTYQSSWYPQTQGGGYALMIQSPTEALSLCDSSSGWEASGTYLGTPGFADPVTLPLPGAVVVNEVLANPTAPSGYPPGDMIEFYNTTSQSINIGGWFVGNNSSGLLGYEIAAGTVIAAGGYYVLTQDYNFGTPASDPGALVPFALDPDGDTVYLSNAYDFTVSSITGYPLVGGGTTATVVVSNTGYPLGAGFTNGEEINISGAAQTQYDGDFTIANVTVNSAAGTTTFTYTVSGSPASPATPIAGQSLAAVLAGGYQEQQTVNSMPPGYSYGLYTKSDGATNFTLLQTPNFGTLTGTTYSGAANSIPYVSPLVTDEIMYDPSQPTAAEAAAGYVDNDFEYVELYNRSSSPVSLNEYHVANGIGGTLRAGSPTAAHPNQFTVSSITLNGTTATVTLNNTSTGM